MKHVKGIGPTQLTYVSATSAEEKVSWWLEHIKGRGLSHLTDVYSTNVDEERSWHLEHLKGIRVALGLNYLYWLGLYIIRIILWLGLNYD